MTKRRIDRKRKISGVIIADIKDALINCNLFSQDDCETLFEHHGKDIANTIAPIASKSSIRHIKTSLKDLIMPAQQTAE